MADITLEERVAYLESLLAARSIVPEDTTTIDELDPVASVCNEDLILVKQNGDEKKATVQNVKDNVMTDVDTKLDNYSTTEEMNEAIEASSPKVSQEPGNVVEMKTDGLFVSEDISGKVESFTQEAYDKLPEADKNDGQIREITDAPDKPVPFATLNDTLMTATNVLSALKIKSMLDVFGFEIASNENGNYLKCANGLLVCWGETVANLITINLPYPYRDNQYVAFGNILATANESAYNGQVNIKQKTTTSVIFPATTEGKRQFFTFGFWK